MVKPVKNVLDVILLVPVYNCSNIFNEWASFIKKLKPKPSRIIFCENNSTDDTLKKAWNFKMKGVKTEVIRYWTVDPRNREVFPFENCYDTIAHARQLLLTRARQLDPDFAIYIDSDIYLQDTDTINTLTIWNKDIIGGAYRRVFPEGLYVATLFYVSPILKERYKKWIKYKKLNANVLIHEVHATSGGCLCLSRKVIQNRKVNFFPVPKGYSEDFGYCKTARDQGFKIYLDGILRLGHKILVKWRSWDIVRKDDNERSKAFDDGSMLKRLKKEAKEFKKMKEEIKRAKKLKELNIDTIDDDL